MGMWKIELRQNNLRELFWEARVSMHLYFIDLLRCLATVLITNSHYNNIWPIPAMATGGSLGNTLFFAISGFCLSSVKEVKFSKWIKKRIIRLYPSVWIVTLIEFVIVNPNIRSVKDFVTYFIYPTQFWFVSAILLFYCLFYIITKYAFPYMNYIIIGVAVIYFVVYFGLMDISRWSIEGNTYFKWIYYFEIMLIAFKLKGSSIIMKKRPLTRMSVMLVGSVAVYFVFKYLLNKFPILMRFQFAVHIISIIFMIVCLLWGFSIEEKLKLISDRKWFCIVTWIGKMTLEIYLVQTFVIRSFETLLFPVNFIVVTVLISLFAAILKSITKLLARFVKG